MQDCTQQMKKNSKGKMRIEITMAQIQKECLYENVAAEAGRFQYEGGFLLLVGVSFPISS